MQLSGTKKTKTKKKQIRLITALKILVSTTQL